MEDQTDPRRGPGRPPGSLNKPKAPPISLAEREALARQLSNDLSEAILCQVLATERIRGLKALAKTRLGPAALHEIEAKLDVAREREAAT